MILKKFYFWMLVSFLISCTSEPQVKEKILARIADRTISVNEFIRRAEYTVRPVWCKNDDYVSRKIVLNSLIAEKLMAIEAGQPEILQNEEIALYLEGRQEQAMRRIHYDTIAKNHVRIEDEQLTIPLQMSERRYRTRIIPINNDALASRISQDLESGKTNFTLLADEFSKVSGSELPEQVIAFDSPVDDAVFSALFENDVQDEQVIGPLKLQKNRNVLIKIDGWNRTPLVSEKQAEQNRFDLTEKIREIRARDIYVDWIAEKMAGKTLNFNARTLESFINIIGPDYFKTAEEKEQAFNKKFWNRDYSESSPAATDQIEQILEQPLFSVNDDVWTVARFEKEIKKHPLVFRNKKMPQGDFTNEFRLAVADLIRDSYITEDAYDLGMDSDPRVKRDVAMWRDNILSLYKRSMILSDHDNSTEKPYTTIREHLDPVVKELFREYNDQIFIDTDTFEKLQLSSVDMFVIHKNMPFPVVVPQFPLLTTHNKLDFGRKMEGSM